MKRFFLFGLFSVLFFPVPVLAKAGTSAGTLQIIIEPVFNGRKLVLDNQIYVDAHGDTLTIDRFRFYLSAISFINKEGNKANEPNSYHLFDAEDSLTNTIIIKNIAWDTYSSISFVIGVDSLSDVSGALGGDLDPVHGMYWTWNTGYIDAKLEGNCKVCKTLHHAFEFHIGGYLPPFAASRNIVLKAPRLIKTESGKKTIIRIQADVAEWFKNPRTIDLSKTNEIVMPGAEAMKMADNYADMFSILSVSEN